MLAIKCQHYKKLLYLFHTLMRSWTLSTKIINIFMSLQRLESTLYDTNTFMTKVKVFQAKRFYFANLSTSHNLIKFRFHTNRFKLSRIHSFFKALNVSTKMRKTNRIFMIGCDLLNKTYGSHNQSIESFSPKDKIWMQKYMHKL